MALGVAISISGHAPVIAGDAPAGSASGRVNLRLVDYLRMVVERNETIQAQLMGTEAARQRAIAEYGVYEPELVGSAQRQANKRENTTEQQRNLAGVPILDERNNLFDGGIESVLPTGGKVHLGYTLNNYNNNLPPFGSTTTDGRTNEWQSFAGATLTQPLLKNGGTSAAMAALRLAAINSQSAFQEYRRQLMVTLSQAESAYWSVYFSQEQSEFLDESVRVAESLLNDAKEKVKAGKGSELDVLEAEAGLALRHTKRTEALQKGTEAMGQLLVFAGRSPRDTPFTYVAVDSPQTDIPELSYNSSWVTAVARNPDYLIQRKKVDEALVRQSFARNQRLPELNLKASAGLNGLGDSPGESFDHVTHGGFPSWSIGAEFRVPIGGGVRGSHELAAADAVVRQSQFQLQGIETQLANALNTAMKKLRHNRATVDDYRTMIRFNERLLSAERDRFNFGKVEGRRVLEVEAGLFEVRQGLADAEVQIERATLELYLAEGSVLERNRLDFSPDELRDQTRILIRKLEAKRPTRGKGETLPASYVPPTLRLRKPEPSE